jgi:hypothetical protein
VSLQAFLAFQLLMAGAAVMVILLAAASSEASGPVRAGLVVAGAVLVFVPAYWLRIKVGMRA